MKKSYAVFSYLILFLFASLYSSDKKPELTAAEKEFLRKKNIFTVACRQNFAPLDFTENGIPKGFLIELLNLAKHKVDIEFNFIEDYNKSYFEKKFDLDKIDIIPASVHDHRILEKSYHTYKILPCYPALVTVKKPYGNKNKKIILVRRKSWSDFEKYGFKRKNVIFVQNPYEAIQNVSSGKADAALIYRDVARYYLKNYNFSANIRIEDLDLREEEYVYGIYFLLNKKYPILSSILNKAILAVSPNDIENLEIKYGLHSSLKKADLTEKEKKFIKQNAVFYLETSGSRETLFPDKNNRLYGFDNDILNLINEYTGANFKIKQPENFDKFHSGTLCSTNESNKKGYLKSKPYIEMPKMIISPKSDRILFQSERDLRDKTIIICNNNEEDQKFAEKIPGSIIIYASNYRELIHKTVNGNADYTIGSNELISLADHLGMPMLDYCFPIDMKVSSRFKVKKDYPEAVSVLNKGLELISSNQKNELYLYWFKFSPLKKFTDIKLTQKEINYLKDNPVMNICLNTDNKYRQSINNNFQITKNYYEYLGEILDVKFDKIEEINSKEIEKNKDDYQLIFFMDKNKTNEKYLSFTKPYISSPFVIITKNTTNLNRHGFWLNKKFCYDKKYNIKDILKKKYPAIELYETDNPQKAMKDVISGKAYGYIELKSAALYEINQARFKNLTIAKELNMSDESCAAVKKEDKILLSILDKAIASIKDAKHAQLQNIFDSQKPPERKRYIPRIIIAILIISCLILFYFFINLRMKYKNLSKKISGKKTSDKNNFNKDIEDQINDNMHALAVTFNHELSQPLMTITGNFEMLKSSRKNKEMDYSEKKYLARIESSIIRIQAILEKYRKNTDIKQTGYSENVKMMKFFSEEETK
ncbi:MAG: hypothetical protein CSB55_04245 [Candidatus Cloacimonadota bacterium]|nr:MAG: hypothetical protein CSB55_04245 [Candidatus Cloacimonadota bacterium]